MGHWSFLVELKRASEKDIGGRLIARLNKTVAEQLDELGLKPQDIDIVGISHMHSDHTARRRSSRTRALLIGKGDFDAEPKGKDDPFGPWRKEGCQAQRR